MNTHVSKHVFIALAAICATGSAFAGTSFNLGVAANYGIVMGSDAGSTSNSFSTNNGTINATVGIESGGFFSASGPGTITGVQFGSAVSDATYTNGTAITSAQTLSGANNSISNTNITNGLTQNASSLLSAATSISALQTLATNSVAGGTATNLNIGTGSITLTAAATGTTVFDTSSVNIGNGGKITITGTANSLVIINVSGTFNAQNNTVGDGIVLSGISADQVLWNISGTGNNFTSSGAQATNIVQGIFLDLAGSYNLNQITVDGWLYGANSDGGTRAGLNDQIVSVFTVNQGTYTPSTPEPSTWATMLGASALIFMYARRRKSADSQSDPSL